MKGNCFWLVPSEGKPVLGLVWPEWASRLLASRNAEKLLHRTDNVGT